MNDYELSKHDFDLIDVVFRQYIASSLGVDPVMEMDVRLLQGRFRLAHTAKIIYE